MAAAMVTGVAAAAAVAAPAVSRTQISSGRCRIQLKATTPLVCKNAASSSQPMNGSRGFVGEAIRVAQPSSRTSYSSSSSRQLMQLTVAKTSIQFIKGVDEPVVPDVRLMRTKDGANGSAIFRFEKPAVFEAVGELGEITGLYLKDEEGEMSSVDVNAKFINGKPANIEARMTLRGQREWERFMRFMDRYAEENNLGFNKKN